MKITIDLQKVSDKYSRPHRSQFKHWAELVCQHLATQRPEVLGGRDSIIVCVRLVEPEESLQINARFKHENKAATILAFSNIISNTDEAGETQIDLLGDLVMCGAKILQQAKEWQVDDKQHWAHLYIHGLLHLFGFEHGDDMEQAETAILQQAKLAAA